MLLYEERRIIGSNYGSANPQIDKPRLLDLYLGGKLKLDEINSAFEAMEKGEVARSVIKF